MAERAQDGGPAFPQAHEQRYNDPVHGVIRPSDIYGEAHPGMSLRDYFAGQYVIGFMAGRDGIAEPRVVAREAYIIAEAMLSAREADRG